MQNNGADQELLSTKIISDYAYSLSQLEIMRTYLSPSYVSD